VANANTAPAKRMRLLICIVPPYAGPAVFRPARRFPADRARELTELRKKPSFLYSQQNVDDPMVHAKFFETDSSWTWYATEESYAPSSRHARRTAQRMLAGG